MEGGGKTLIVASLEVEVVGMTWQEGDRTSLALLAPCGKSLALCSRQKHHWVADKLAGAPSSVLSVHHDEGELESCCGLCCELQVGGKLSREAQSSRCHGGPANSFLRLHLRREPCTCTASLL